MICGIRTQIVRVRGNHGDHLSTSKQKLYLKLGNTSPYCHMTYKRLNSGIKPLRHQLYSKKTFCSCFISTFEAHKNAETCSADSLWRLSKNELYDAKQQHLHERRRRKKFHFNDDDHRKNK